MANITEIIVNGTAEGKSFDEINKELKEAGFDTVLTDGTKSGNAVLFMGETNLEIVTVKDGKLVNGAGCGSSDYVVYMGDVYHTENGDNVTLVPGYPAPSSGDPTKIPDKFDKSRRMDLIGKPESERTGIIQHTSMGDFVCDYDEDGYLHSAVKKG